MDTEHTYPPQLVLGLKIFGTIIGVIIISTVSIFIWIKLPQTPVEDAVVMRQSDEVTLTGSIVLGVDVDESLLFDPYLFTYSFDTNLVTQLYDTSAVSFDSVDTEHSLLISYHESDIDPDGYQPSWVENKTHTQGMLEHTNAYNETDIVVSPSQERYAYAYQENPNLEMNDLSNWSVAVYDDASKDPLIIKGAAEPAFFFDEKEILSFLTADGIFAYHLDTAESYPLFTEFGGLTNNVDYDISPDSSTLIFTIPSMYLISVAQYSKADAAFLEVESIVSDSVRYRHPVIDPTSQLYAVVASADNDFNPSGTYPLSIQIRSVGTKSVIKELTSSGLGLSRFWLQNWIQ